MDKDRTDKSIGAVCSLTELVSAPGAGAALPLDWLPDPVLLYFKSGAYTLMLNLEKHEILEECICFVNPGTVWQLTAHEDTEGQVFMLRFAYDALRPLYGGPIDEELLKPLSEGKLHCRDLIRMSELGYLELLHATNRLLRAFRGSAARPGDEERRHYTVQAVMDQLLVQAGLLQVLGLCESFGWIRELRPEDEDRQVQLIKNALIYIREHFREKIYIHDLSGLGGLNDQYFIRFFKSVMGLPPLDYINRYRVLRAAEALAQTDRRICDIAEDCGFHNIGNFIKVFRSFMGTTPREYRKDPDAYQEKEKKE